MSTAAAQSKIQNLKSKIVLASASPRRRELLGALGIDFEVRPANINEDPLPGESPLDTQHRITREKARASEPVTNNPQPTTIIACDTTVLLDGEMLNKPADAAEAWAMLRALRNRTHEVQSCIVIKQGEEEIVDIVSSQVVMRDYSDDEIATYIATGDPFDKAGSYAVQHEQFHPVAEIRGCPLNVIGLALCHLRAHLPQLPDCEGVCEAYSGKPCSQHLPIVKSSR
ncbi:MAG: septum formation protein Maf [Anaerolineae bacterium]|nr:septum formation protein Maf [Anaerolineae bacterium]